VIPAHLVVKNHTPSSMSLPLLILYATQTGNAECVAEKVADAARARGYEPRTWNVDGLDVKSLSTEQRALFVVSTYGEGDPPDAAVPFWDEVQHLAAGALASLRYSVYALGDSSYTEFCGFGKKLDEELEKAGATRIADRCDNDLDYESALDAWIESAFGGLAKT
jgi:sulfite reductase (NADPH) flavoprotein alpha-component